MAVAPPSPCSASPDAGVQDPPRSTHAAAPAGPLPTTTVRSPALVAAIAVVRSPGSHATGCHVRPSAVETAIAIAGGCWTPTPRKPAAVGVTPNSWLAAAGWHGEQWNPGSSDGACVTTSGCTTSANAQAAGSIAAGSDAIDDGVADAVDVADGAGSTDGAEAGVALGTTSEPQAATSAAEATRMTKRRT